MIGYGGKDSAFAYIYRTKCGNMGKIMREMHLLF